MKTEGANVAIPNVPWYISWGGKDFEEANKIHSLMTKPRACLVLLCSYIYPDIGETCHQKEGI